MAAKAYTLWRSSSVPFPIREPSASGGRDLVHWTRASGRRGEEHIVARGHQAASEDIDDRLRPPYAGGGTGIQGGATKPMRT